MKNFIHKFLIIVLQLILLLTGLINLSACNNSSSRPQVLVLREQGDSSWIYDGIKIEKYRNEKVIVFIGTGFAEDEDSAKELARMDGYSAAAIAIKGIIHKQRKIVQDKLGNAGAVEILNTGIEITIARNANVSGIGIIAGYYRIIKSPKFSKEFCQWFVRMAMPYNKLKQRRDEFLLEYQRENAAFKNKWKLVFENFNQLDNVPDGGIGHIELTAEERELRENPFRNR